MNITEHDKSVLRTIGVQIDGAVMRIEDSPNKVTHEFKIEDLAQLFLKKKFALGKRIKSSDLYALVICTWDCKRIKLSLSEFDLKKVKDTLKRLNGFFYTES